MGGTSLPQLDVAVDTFVAERMCHKSGNFGHIVDNLEVIFSFISSSLNR
jgi:hypothetical protein